MTHYTHTYTHTQITERSRMLFTTAPEQLADRGGSSDIMRKNNRMRMDEILSNCAWGQGEVQVKISEKELKRK